MATAATIKKNIAKLEAALKSKATPKSLKPKLETQLVKSKAELSGMNKGTKPKTSSTKSTQTALQKLKAMVNKNKKYKTYKGAGVDLEKDADRPALRTGKRVTDGTHYPYKKGNVYYEYRANRIDVKQPPKKYPKLEQGGYMAKGGMVDYSKDGYVKAIRGVDGKLVKEVVIEGVEYKYNPIYKTYNSIKGNELLHKSKYEKGGYMAKGGEMAQVNKMSKDELKNWLSENYGYRGVDGKGITKELKDRTIVNMRKEVLSQMKYNEKNNIKYSKGGKTEKKKFTAYTILEADEYGNRDSSSKKKPTKFYIMWYGNSYQLWHEQPHTINSRIIFDNDDDFKKAIDKVRYSTPNYVNYGLPQDQKFYKEFIVSEKFEYAKGGYMAKGGQLEVGDMVMVDDSGYVKYFSGFDTNNPAKIISKDKGKSFGKVKYFYGLETADGKKPFNQAIESMLTKVSKDGGMMATGGKAAGTYRVMVGKRKQRILADDMTRDEAKDYMKKYNDKHPEAELELRYNMTEADNKSVSDNIDKAMKDFMSSSKMAKGGVTEKEVVESNAEMVLSQIKAVKHHAQELSNVVSKNSDIEAWVVAKIERASTDLSDITHYLEFQTKKMAMGGEIHRTQD